MAHSAETLLPQVHSQEDILIISPYCVTQLKSLRLSEPYFLDPPLDLCEGW